MADKKRERGKNYTEQDKEMLLNIVQTYTHIVENKKTDGSSVKLKSEAWEKIAQEYNAMTQTGTRTAWQLKALYESMKKKVKKDKAQEKIELYQTGGGVPKNKGSRDPLEIQLEGVISNVTAEIVNIYDSNAPLDELSVVNTEKVHSEIDTSSGISYTTVAVGTDPEPSQGSLQPGVPYHKTKKIKPSIQQEKEELKLDILRIRKDKEALTKDILALKKKRLELKLKNELLEARDKHGEDV